MKSLIRRSQPFTRLQVRCLSTTPSVPTLQLVNGVEVPMVGFGCAFFQDGISRPELALPNVRRALDLGYTHIDTAHMYGCEPQIGHVLQRSFLDGIPREDIFITTKSGHPPTSDFTNAKTQWLYDPKLSAYDGVLEEFYTSLKDLGVGYVDMLLLHWPGMFDSPNRFAPGYKVTMPTPELAAEKRADMWRACEHIYQQGFTRAIGVSNYTEYHFEAILPHCTVAPMMNQFECHPYLQQTAIRDFCATHNISCTAYMPLASGALNVVEDPVVVELAKQKGVNPGQLVLTWLVQQGIVVIPKSSNPQRMVGNLDVNSFVLSPEEMAGMAALDKNIRVCVDPNAIL